MTLIDEIKKRVSIEDLVAEYTALKQSGSALKGRCPFHTEKTPSFFVFPEKGSWHCFGACAAGGDVLTFFQKAESLEFKEALRRLAERAGIKLEEHPVRKETKQLYHLNTLAAAGFHKFLYGNSQIAKEAREYLQKRGVNLYTQTSFQLGCSPVEDDFLVKAFQKAGHKVSDVVQAGLAIRKEDRYTDMFRGRLMFPIKNASGQVLGFGARSLRESAVKYINTPQTVLFSKKDLLYGLDQARDSIKEKGSVIIVEGYMDCLAAHQHGVTNCVASMGTALSQEQMEQIKHLTRKIFMALDADVAGQHATLKALSMARSVFVESSYVPDWLGGTRHMAGEFRVIPLPSGQDPDEVIQSGKWEDMVKQSVTLMDYIFDVVVKGMDASSVEGKTAISDTLLPIIKEVANSTEQRLYLNRLAQLVGVEDRVLLGPTAMPRLARRRVDKPEVKFHAEDLVASIMLSNPDLPNELTSEHFERPENKEIYCMEFLLEDLNGHLKDHIDYLMGLPVPPAGQEKRVLDDCMVRLNEHRIKRVLALQKLLIKDAEKRGDQEEVLNLLDKFSIGRIDGKKR